MRSPKMPTADSIAELAKFWDSYDLIEFDDQLEEVTEPVFERKQGNHHAPSPEHMRGGLASGCQEAAARRTGRPDLSRGRRS